VGWRSDCRRAGKIARPCCIPDTIVQRCFRVRKSDGERVISNKWRTHYAQKIKEFCDRTSKPDAPRVSKDVLSFLIHNGVMVQV
jgi:hypothetical protein